MLGSIQFVNFQNSKQGIQNKSMHTYKCMLLFIKLAKGVQINVLT